MFSQEEFREKLVKWIILSDEPFSTVEEPAFVEMIHSLNPKAEIISDKTVRADLMAIYEKLIDEIKIELSTVPGKLSFTMDGWTAKNVLPFVAIRAHWLDSTWSYKSKMLDFAYVRGEHNGLKLKDIFMNCLSRFDIPIEKVLAITVDNASNNDTFFMWLEECGLTDLMNHIRCIAHIMNLSVQDMLDELKIPCPLVYEPDGEDPLENEVGKLI